METVEQVLKKAEVKEMQRPDVDKLANYLELLKSDIEDDMVDDPDGEPYMDITLGCDEKGFGLQTGDNSFFGNAYMYRHWGVLSLLRNSNTRELAEELISQCEEQYLSHVEL